MVRLLVIAMVTAACLSLVDSAFAAPPDSNPRIVPFLMFQNNKADEAARFYMSIFPDSKMVSLQRYGKGEDGTEGTVKLATIRVMGQTLTLYNSPIEHMHTFTPSMSLFVKCTSERQVDELFGRLSDGGKVLVALDKYPFSKRFVWLNDKFGVSWQLSFND